MIIKITARFSDTESAEFTLGRLSETVKTVYELRLYYDTEHDGNGLANNIFYSAKNSFLPYRSRESVSFPFELDREDKLYSECFVSVVCDSDDVEQIRSIVYNGGGFDVDVSEL